MACAVGASPERIEISATAVALDPYRLPLGQRKPVLAAQAREVGLAERVCAHPDVGNDGAQQRTVPGAAGRLHGRGQFGRGGERCCRTTAASRPQADRGCEHQIGRQNHCWRHSMQPPGGDYLGSKLSTCSVHADREAGYRWRQRADGCAYLSAAFTESAELSQRSTASGLSGSALAGLSMATAGEVRTSGLWPTGFPLRRPGRPPVDTWISVVDVVAMSHQTVHRRTLCVQKVVGHGMI